MKMITHIIIVFLLMINSTIVTYYSTKNEEISNIDYGIIFCLTFIVSFLVFKFICLDTDEKDEKDVK